MTFFNSFADLAQARINLADAREGITESYDGAFLEHSDLAKLNIIEAPIAAEMPDPDMARRAVEMAIGTIFDVLKDGSPLTYYGIICPRLHNFFINHDYYPIS